MRSFSVPADSTVNVSSAGNLIEVSVFPKWIIESAIPTLLVNVETPATDNPAPMFT